MLRDQAIFALLLLVASITLSIDDFYPFGEEYDTTLFASATAAPPPTKPKSKVTPWHCDNGAPACRCTPEWTGNRCDIPIDYCTNPPQVPKGDVMMAVPFCGENGHCRYDRWDGSHCVCNEGYYGDFCQHMNKTKRVSDRCLIGRTNYTMRNEHNKTAVETTYQCNIGSEICVPDNMNCYNNYPPRFRDGQPYCDQGWEYNDRSIKCQCQYPVGWCVPAEAGGYLVRNFFKAKAQAMLSCNQNNPLVNSQQNVDNEQFLDELHDQLKMNAVRMFQDEQYESGREPTTAYTAPWWMDTTEYERISSPPPTEPTSGPWQWPTTAWPSEVSTGHTHFEWTTAEPDFPDTTAEPWLPSGGPGTTQGYSGPVKPGSVVCDVEAVRFNLDTRSFIWSSLGASGDLVIRLNTSNPNCSDDLIYTNAVPPFIKPPPSDPTAVTVAHRFCPYPIVPIYMNYTHPSMYTINLYVYAQHGRFDPTQNCTVGSGYICTDGPEYPFEVSCTFPEHHWPGHIDFTCDNYAEPYCTCDSGWTGPECQIAINYCDTPPQIPRNHTMFTVPLCGENGHCVYDPTLGTFCFCDEGYYGDFCQHMRKTKYVADRCIMRATQYTNAHSRDIETGYECNKTAEICIPDDMDCYRSTPASVHLDMVGCSAGREIDPATSRCICQYPVGWCIPSHVANMVVKNYFKEDTKKAVPET